MLHEAASYEELVGGFRWQVPDLYNIGVDVCDRHAIARGGSPSSSRTRAARSGATASMTSRRSRRGVSNVAGYANPALDTLADRALSTLDDGKRDALLQEAMALAASRPSRWRSAARDRDVILVHAPKRLTY